MNKLTDLKPQIALPIAITSSGPLLENLVLELISSLTQSPSNRHFLTTMW